MEIQGTNTFLQDCEVSDWITTECSVTRGCGKEISSAASSCRPLVGPPCSPLTMTRECGMDTCPTDCELSYWSDYSDCSAKCGGGIQMRSRQILQEP